MKNNINSTTKSKKRKILIYSNDEFAKNHLFKTISEKFKIVSKKDRDVKEITFEFWNNKKNHVIKLTDAINLDTVPNTTIDFSFIHQMDGIIFLFHKYSNESLIHVKQFIKSYHEVIGNKFFPCLFLMIDNEKVISTYKDRVDVINTKDIGEITLNYSFPLIKILKNFDEKEIYKIFNNLFIEIKKEKRDDFPYSLAFQEQLEINFCIKNIKIFKFINILIFVLILIFCLLDTIFIITTPDFLNELKKVDDIFLGIRLNMNAINFISSVVFLRYTMMKKEKYMKIRRLEKYFLIINVISVIIQMILHFRIKHLLFHNETYYSIRIYQILIVILMLISFQILKFLSMSSPQTFSKRTDSFMIVRSDTTVHNN